LCEGRRRAYGEIVPIQDAIAPVMFIGGGFMLGLLTGRWWVLFVCLIPGSWASLTYTNLEVDSWWFGIVFGAMTALGVLLGVAARRFAPRILR
jgi:hypothetical protein